MWNTKTADRNGVNKKKQTHAHQILREWQHWKGLVSMKISDRVPPPFFTPPPLISILLIPPFLWEKSVPPFWENFENSTPSPL